MAEPTNNNPEEKTNLPSNTQNLPSQQQIISQEQKQTILAKGYITPEEYYKLRKQEQSADSTYNILLASGATYAIYKVLTSQKISLETKLKYLDAIAPTKEIIDPKTGKKYLRRSLGNIRSDNLHRPLDFIAESLRIFEEETPFKVGRTFHLSQFASNYQFRNDLNFHFRPSIVRSQEVYFAKYLERYGLRNETGELVNKITATDKELGLFALSKVDEKGNKITQIVGAKRNESGAIVADTNRIFVDKGVTLFTTHNYILKNDKSLIEQVTRDPDILSAKLPYDESFKSTNPIAKHYSDLLGVSRTHHFDDLFNEGLPFLPGNSKDLYWEEAYARSIFYRGVRIFDNPLEDLQQQLPTIQGNPVYNFFKKLTRFNLGTEGDYSLSIPKATLKMSLNIGKKLAIGYGIFSAADFLAKSFAPKDSGFEDGVIPGLATAGVNLQIKKAELIDDKFQNLRENQEAIAPGSTSLFQTMGLPLQFAMIGAFAEYAQRMVEIRKKGLEGSELKASLRTRVGKTELFNLRSTKYALTGFGLGLLLQAPFIPGALVAGKSSEELKDIYSGEQLEPYRKNRFWLTASTDAQGNKIEAFVPNWYARMMSENSEDVKFKGEKDKLNPIKNPLGFLENPYMLEEHTQDVSPSLIYGMDTTTGGFLNPAFESTLGQILKPDKINPSFQKYFNTDHKIEIDKLQSKREREQIQAGIKIEDRKAVYDPLREHTNTTYASFKDFIGIFGFGADTLEKNLKLNEIDERQQISRSGEYTNESKSFLQANLGGVLCVTPDTMITTINGKVRIDEINIGDLVLTKDGSFKPVLQVHKRHTVEEILEIKFSTLHTSLKCTKNHEIYSCIRERYKSGHTNTELIFKKNDASYLSKGDYVVSPIVKINKNLNLIDLSKYSTSRFTEKYIYEDKMFDDYICCDEEFQYFKVSEIKTFNYEGYVYDLTIDEIHYYVANDILISNSFGESQRRFLPTTAGTLPDRYNPLKNRAAPSWLPGDNSDFYINFSRGDYYSKVDLGYSRLPGEGIKLRYPELEGIDPEQYSVVHRFAILADVAPGSKEFYEHKKLVDKLSIERKLSDTDKELLLRTEREMELKNKPNFIERKRPEEIDSNSPFGVLLNKYSEFIYRDLATSPTDYLTPFRPGDKFIHQRSAIEDYERVMYYGKPDAAVWDKPLDYFLGPATEDIARRASMGNYKPHRRKEIERVEDYFDKLEYLKYRSLYTQALSADNKALADKYKKRYQKTVIGAKTSQYSDGYIGTPDADTIVYKGKTYRFYGIDAPESNQPGGAEAMAYMRKLLLNTPGEIRIVEKGKEAHKRSLAEIYVGDINVNLELVKQGLAHHSEHFHPELTEYAAAENKARAQGKGTFAEGQNPVEPFIWRKLHPKPPDDAEKELMKQYLALPKQERKYFTSFVNAPKDQRDKIRKLVPENYREIYEMAWFQKDIVEREMARGTDSETITYILQNESYKRKQRMYDMNASASANYDKEYKTKEQRAATTKEEYIADVEAIQTLKQATGVPQQGWIGWHPLYDTEKLKIKTLAVGGEDISRYGYWPQQLQEIDREYPAIVNDPIVDKLADIKNNVRVEHQAKFNIFSMLSDQNYVVKDVQLEKDYEGAVQMEVKQPSNKKNKNEPTYANNAI